MRMFKNSFSESYFFLSAHFCFIPHGRRLVCRDFTFIVDRRPSCYLSVWCVKWTGRRRPHRHADFPLFVRPQPHVLLEPVVHVFPEEGRPVDLLHGAERHVRIAGHNLNRRSLKHCNFRHVMRFQYHKQSLLCILKVNNENGFQRWRWNSCYKFVLSKMFCC